MPDLSRALLPTGRSVISRRCSRCSTGSKSGSTAIATSELQVLLVALAWASGDVEGIVAAVECDRPSSSQWNRFPHPE